MKAEGTSPQIGAAAVAHRFELEPFVRAGNLRFGMSEAEITDVLRGYGLTWGRADCDPFSPNLPARVVVENDGLSLGFDGNGALDTIEFCSGSSPWFRGVNLIETSILDFVRLVNGIGGRNWLLTTGGLFCADVGLGFSNQALFYSEDQEDNEYGDRPRIVWAASRKSTIGLIQERMGSFQDLLDMLKDRHH